MADQIWWKPNCKYRKQEFNKGVGIMETKETLIEISLPLDGIDSYVI